MNATEKRRPGRPPLAEPNPATARLEARVDPALRRRVRLAAVAADRSMQDWLIDACMEKLERDEPAQPS